ncbi:MAG: mechanosensitive ion channel domain-containing protein [Pseudomonadota bacterium]
MRRPSGAGVIGGLAVLLCLLLLAPVPVAAQATGYGGAAGSDQSVTVPETIPDTPEAVREMVSRLSDQQVRALLLERLDAVATDRAAAAAGGGFRETIETAASTFASSVLLSLQRAVNIPGGVAEGVGKFWEPRGFTGTLHLLAVLAVSLGLGHLAERGVARILPAAVPPVEDATKATLSLSLRFLLHRLLWEAAGVAAFILAAWMVMAVAAPPEPISYLILTFFLTIPVLYARLTVAIGRFFLAPHQPQMRLLRLDDRSAKTLHRGAIGFALLVGLTQYALSFLGGHGVDLESMRLGFWLTLLSTVWLVGVIWRVRAGLQQVLLSNETAGPIERRVAQAYPYVAIGLIACAWVLSEVLAGFGLWGLLDGRLTVTTIVVILSPLADTAIRSLAAHLVPIPTPRAGEVRHATAIARRRGFVRMGRVATFSLLLVFIVDFWNIDPNVVSMGPLPAQAGVGLLEAAGIIALGYLVFEAVTLWLRARIAAEVPEQDDDDEVDTGGEGGGAGGSRLSTVLPLLLRTLQVVIVLATAFEALSVLGVSIAPLIAGLGILGLAIGFGAQKLVADVVSGVFFLVDDAFRVGEYVEIDGTFGTVEQISIRSLQLRHHEGPVHTIPFGEIPKLTNYSRDWVIMKLRFTVPFDTDLGKVKKLFKQIGKEMMDDPVFAVDFLQPFKSQGVLEVNDVGIVLRGKFMAKPGRQWVLRKEIYARVQKAFDENGIQFARREVRVRIDGDDQSPEARREAAAAAAEAVQAAEPPA